MKRINLLLDSGAYTVWTKNKKIDIDEYIKFCIDNKKHFFKVVCLDVLPGKPGIPPTIKEVEESAKQSWDNYLYMKSKGVNSIPVFHQGDNFKWLHNMIDNNCDYIGISQTFGSGYLSYKKWFDNVFTAITDDNGIPVVKTHGFGLTSVPLLFRYPWYSADSTAWKLVASYGAILVPKIKNGAYIYNVRPRRIIFSNKKINEKQHWDNLTLDMRDEINIYLCANGINVDKLRTDYPERAFATGLFFNNLGKAHSIKKFKFKKQGFIF